MEEAFLARASATILPERFTWVKITEEKLGSKYRTSSTIFPKEDSIQIPRETAKITVAESPSKITRWRSSLAANWTALRQVRASISATNDNNSVDIDRALRGAPRQSRAMTPRPAKFTWLKSATLKFTLTYPISRGRHWCRAKGRGRGAFGIWLEMNSWSRALATVMIFEVGWASRPKWRAFRLFHKHQVLRGKYLMFPNRLWGSQAKTQRWALEIKSKGYRCSVSPPKQKIEATP